jgi:hypothetical protein
MTKKSEQLVYMLTFRQEGLMEQNPLSRDTTVDPWAELSPMVPQCSQTSYRCAKRSAKGTR